MIAKFDGLDYHLFFYDKSELESLFGENIICRLLDFNTGKDLGRKTTLTYWENKNPEGVYLRHEKNGDISIFIGFNAFEILEKGRAIYTTYEHTDNKVRVMPPRQN